MSVAFAVLGLDHRHAFGMAQGMLAAGGRLLGWWTEGTPHGLDGFRRRFPDAPRRATVDEVLDDDRIDLVLIAAPPEHRAALAVRAMERGLDVMVDKPGCLTVAELDRVRDTAAPTGRIWSIDFSERFEVPAMTHVDELMADGAIGRLVHVSILAPHRLNAATRPDWFWDRRRAGGILADIGTHQIDQVLHLARADGARIVHAEAGNVATPRAPGFQDFGQMLLEAGGVRAHARLDWLTPAGLPAWGDGRLTLLGTKGAIEVRKYVDVAGRPGGDHVFVTNGSECRHVDASGAGTPYFARLAADVRDRTETAAPQAHTFRVTALAIEAQAMADAALDARGRAA